jgi:hypothetical protein
MPEHRSIGELAYRLWQSRGCPEGTADQDWLDAERQLLAMESAAAPKKSPRAAAAAAAAIRTTTQRAEEYP